MMKPNAKILKNETKTIGSSSTPRKKKKADYKTRHNIGSRQASDRVVTYSESGRSIYDSPIYTDYSEYDIGNISFKALKSRTPLPIKRPRTRSRSKSPSNKVRKLQLKTDDGKWFPSKKVLKVENAGKSNQQIGLQDRDQPKNSPAKRQSKCKTASSKLQSNVKSKNVRNNSTSRERGNKTDKMLKGKVKTEGKIEDCFKEICKSVIRLAKSDLKKDDRKKRKTKNSADSQTENKDEVKKIQAKKLARKYKNLKPKKLRAKREASLNATAMMNLLYVSPAKKLLKIRDSSPQKREDSKDLVVKSKSRKSDPSPVKVKKEKDDDKSLKSVKATKPTKTQRLKRSRELKSLLPSGQTIDKNFLKTFDKQPGVWTHQRRLASLNAQAILSASKDIDFRREKGVTEKSKVQIKHHQHVAKDSSSSGNCTCSGSSSSSVSTVSREVIEVASENVIQTMHTTVEKSVPEVYKVTKIMTKDSIKGHWVTQQVHKNGSVVQGEQNTIKWSNKKLVERSSVTSNSCNAVNDPLKRGAAKTPAAISVQQQQTTTTGVVMTTVTAEPIDVSRPRSTNVSASQALLVGNQSATMNGGPSLYPYSHGSGVTPSDAHCQRLTIGGMGSVSNYSMQQPSAILTATYPRTYQSAFAACNSHYYQHGYFQPAGPMIQAVPESYVVHHPVPLPVSQADMKIVYHSHGNQNIPPSAGIQPPTPQPPHLVTHQYGSNMNQPVQSMVYNPQIEMNSNNVNMYHHQNAPLGQHPGNNYPPAQMPPPPSNNDCNWALSSVPAECNQWQQQPTNADCNWQSGGNNDYWQMQPPQQNCNWQQPGNWQQPDYTTWQQQTQPSQHSGNCNWQTGNQQQAMNCNWPNNTYHHQSSDAEVYNSMPAACTINVSEPAEASAKSVNSSIEPTFLKQKSYQAYLEDESSDLDIDVVGTDECKLQTEARKQKDLSFVNSNSLMKNDPKIAETKLEQNETSELCRNMVELPLKSLNVDESLKTMTTLEKPALNDSIIKKEILKKDSLKPCLKTESPMCPAELRRTIKKETVDKKSSIAPRKMAKCQSKPAPSKKDVKLKKPKKDNKVIPKKDNKLLSKLKKTVKTCQNKITEKKSSLMKNRNNLPLARKNKNAVKQKLLKNNQSNPKKSLVNKIVVVPGEKNKTTNKTVRNTKSPTKNTSANKNVERKSAIKRANKKLEPVRKNGCVASNKKIVNSATKKDQVSSLKKSENAAAVKKSKIVANKKLVINGIKKSTSTKKEPSLNFGKKVEVSCWKWIGQPELKPVYPVIDGPPVQKLCYPSIQHSDGDTINVRDCVLIKSGPRKKDLPYVAKISSFWESPEGDMMMSLLWYYRPEHTEAGRLPSHMQCELFASRHRDENSIACIEDKCFVLTFNQYCRYRAHLKMETDWRRKRLPPVPHPSDMKLTDLPLTSDPQNIFICRRVYDFRQKRILKNPT